MFAADAPTRGSLALGPLRAMPFRLRPRVLSPRRPPLRLAATLGLSLTLAACGGGSKTTVTVLPTGTAADCRALASASLTGLLISEASVQEAASGYPVHCLTRGTTLDGRVRFELRNPLSTGWNGRLIVQGTGAFAGQLDPAFGLYRSSESPGLLAQGYAVLSNDTGHTGAQNFETYFLPLLDASWALNHPQAEQDFADRGTAAATQAGQTLLRELFRRSRLRTYYVGCSGAGGQGMRMAERAETLFDGFVIGDPTLAMARDMQRVQWNLRAVTAYPLSLPKLRVLSAGVMQHCDPKDGATDGIVSDPSRCDFDITTLACPAGTDRADCLTTNEQLAAALIYSGPRNSANEAVAPGLPLTGSEDCGGFCDGGIDGFKRFAEGWPWWFLGGPTSYLDDPAAPAPLPTGRSFGAVVFDQYVRFLGSETDDASRRWFTHDAIGDPSLVARGAALYDIQRSDFSSFRTNGKRILMYSGWADALISPLELINFQLKVAAASGGFVETRDFFRLFLVPGMQHCEGGRALDDFDAVDALVRWVENNEVPNTLRARSRWNSAFPGRERDLCPYPEVSTYVGSGSVDDPASFRCTLPGS